MYWTIFKFLWSYICMLILYMTRVRVCLCWLIVHVLNNGHELVLDPKIHQDSCLGPYLSRQFSTLLFFMHMPKCIYLPVRNQIYVLLYIYIFTLLNATLTLNCTDFVIQFFQSFGWYVLWTNFWLNLPKFGFAGIIIIDL